MIDSKKEEIKKSARQIMDKFAKALENVKEKVEEVNVEREQDRRAEEEGKSSSSEFRDLILNNAPNKNKDFILAEKKKW